MHSVQLTNRNILLYSFFLLFPIYGTAIAETSKEFQINGIPVPHVVANVNGTELSSDLLKREMIAYRLLEKRQEKTGGIKGEEKIARAVLMKAIDDELIYQQGLNLNINIDKATIDRELKNIQSNFPSKKLFLTALAAQRLTFDILKKNIKRTLVKEEFIRANIASKVHVSDSEVKSFYDQNKETFIKPETFKIRHIYVSIPGPGDGEADSVQDRAKAKEIIDWVKNEAKKKIIQASLALKKGKSFSMVVNEFSEDSKTSDTGGNLGFIMKHQTLPEISNIMIKLKIGEISSIIDSSLGFHIIQLTDKKESHPISLEKVTPEILNHLLKLETEDQLKKYLSELRKKSNIIIFI
jgi:foldase protein PrsA